MTVANAHTGKSFHSEEVKEKLLKLPPTPAKVESQKHHHMLGLDFKLRTTLKAYRVQGVAPSVSPLQEPVWSLQKPDGSWRMTDYKLKQAAAHSCH